MPPVKRISHIYPAPTTDARALPIAWTPTSSVVADWGTLKVLMNGTDRTTFRDIPSEVLSWSTGEPFGYKTAAIRFRMIHPWEELPSWLNAFSDVQIILVRPNATQKILWRGMIGSEEDVTEDSGGGVTVHCIGALYQADFYIKKPRLSPPISEDLWTIVQRELEPDDPGGDLPNRSGARWLAPTGPALGSTGIQFTSQGSWEPLLTGYLADLLGRAVESDGDQWTIDISDTLVPILKLKDRVTISWRFRIGQPGINHSLSRDYSMSPNAFYGDGIDLKQCHWRNTRYPPPGVDPATYPDPTPPPGYLVSDVNRTPPLPLSKPFFQPVIENFRTARWWRTVAEGAIIGTNPGWDDTIVRIESYQNFGSYVTREEGGYSAAIEFERRSPKYTGSINFKADPEEGSRFEIAAGQNLLMRGHRGVAGRTIHISDVEVDWTGQTVTCQVDEAARDALTVAAVMNRERQNNDPSLRPQRTYRNSRAVEDRKAAVWDCESGAGLISPKALTGGAWNTIQIPGGTAGTIINTQLTVTPSTSFAIGVFDRPPPTMSGAPSTDNYWDQFGDATGLLIAWGAGTEKAGYSPGSQSGGGALTGLLKDDASWYYQSEQPPWLWLVVYPTASCSISGLFRPGADY